LDQVVIRMRVFEVISISGADGTASKHTYDRIGKRSDFISCYTWNYSITPMEKKAYNFNARGTNHRRVVPRVAKFWMKTLLEVRDNLQTW